MKKLHLKFGTLTFGCMHFKPGHYFQRILFYFIFCWKHVLVQLCKNEPKTLLPFVNMICQTLCALMSSTAYIVPGTLQTQTLSQSFPDLSAHSLQTPTLPLPQSPLAASSLNSSRSALPLCTQAGTPGAIINTISWGHGQSNAIPRPHSQHMHQNLKWKPGESTLPSHLKVIQELQALQLPRNHIFVSLIHLSHFPLSTSIFQAHFLHFLNKETPLAQINASSLNIQSMLYIICTT